MNTQCYLFWVCFVHSVLCTYGISHVHNLYSLYMVLFQDCVNKVSAITHLHSIGLLVAVVEAGITVLVYKSLLSLLRKYLLYVMTVSDILIFVDNEWLWLLLHIITLYSARLTILQYKSILQSNYIWVYIAIIQNMWLTELPHQPHLLFYYHDHTDTGRPLITWHKLTSYILAPQLYAASGS